MWRVQITVIRTFFDRLRIDHRPRRDFAHSLVSVESCAGNHARGDSYNRTGRPKLAAPVVSSQELGKLGGTVGYEGIRAGVGLEVSIKRRC